MHALPLIWSFASGACVFLCEIQPSSLSTSTPLAFGAKPTEVERHGAQRKI